jgi:hypothetical protein
MRHDPLEEGGHVREQEWFVLVDDDRGGCVKALDVDETRLDPELRHERLHLGRQVDELNRMVRVGSDGPVAEYRTACERFHRAVPPR